MPQDTQTDDNFLWNLTQIGRAFELNRDTVRKRLVQAGLKSAKTEKGIPLYSLAQAAEAVFAGQQHQVEYNPNELSPKDRKEFFQSENERLKFEKDERQLVPIHEMALEFSRALKLFIQALESLPDILEERCDLNVEGQETVIQITNEVREDLYKVLVAPTEEDTEERLCQPPTPKTSS
ncbi:DUF1441 family protein [Algicola sagamiensis]|uniref:DUF1441 family protein n=1 Tax=Algicola sagamiensis TaxID=163869 RepID=UPI0003676FF8|nr:DUF1441 family protein [Algicola sagamiensis]